VQTPAPHRPDGSAINLSVIDKLRALDTSGSMGLARAVLEAFRDSAGLSMVRVQAALKQGNTQALGEAAHALKSSSANVGAQELSVAYQEMERLARADQIDNARTLFERVRQEQERAVQTIDELLLELT
jgi:two-component system, sensor histidine kinase and response regulator